MICVKELVKNFDDVCAVNNITLNIPEGEMLGLLGTNGAGKTTLLRMIAGVLEADGGSIVVDGANITSGDVSEEIFYLPDDSYFFPNASMEEMILFYKKYYPRMDAEAAAYMAGKLNLETKRPLRTFSKGMKRQAFLILALCAGTKYLLCDEVFDGLDPIVTEVMKNLFRQEMKERKFTVVVASHKLRELEDICHSIAILHKGGVLTSKDMRHQAGNICKYQCVFSEQTDLEEVKKAVDLIRFHADGYFVTLIVRMQPETMARLNSFSPVFMKEVPMTLEEIFIAEMEGKEYDIRKVLR